MTTSLKRPLNYSFSTLGCPKADWHRAAELARAAGFALELRALRGNIDLPSALKAEFETPGNMARVRAASGVNVVSLDSSMRLFGAEEEHRREVATLAAWADALGIAYLRVFDGGEKGAGGDPAVRAAMKRELDAWASLREEKGFRCDLMIETHWALVDPEHCLCLAEETGGRLNILWDVDHVWRHGGVAPVDDWEKLKPLVRHIHIKDSVRDAASCNGFRHTLPGDGEIPVVPLLERLADERFAGPVSLEWECFWNPEMPPLEQALEAGRQHGWW